MTLTPARSFHGDQLFFATLTIDYDASDLATIDIVSCTLLTMSWIYQKFPRWCPMQGKQLSSPLLRAPFIGANEANTSPAVGDVLASTKYQLLT
ncbi:hypothetical protein PIB30_062132 [Stylosanthes scabra]|uniref:Uncharacterized protein n=1 Tax=Stylosanthes scabra TaxID=79078 RepID=A0ABU6ZJT5_9FABA|nr:hypothetical protein [Stylosanthes scabra]